MAITSTATNAQASKSARPTANAGAERSAMPRLPQRHPSALQLLRESLQQEGDATTPAPAAPPHVAAAPAPAVSGFSARQRELLVAPLDRAKVRHREQGRLRVSYLEGWQVIAEANRIFGFDGWDRLTLNASCVAEYERPVGRDRKSGWGVTYTARVRIVVIAGERCLIREGSGAGHGIDLDQGLAHESARALLPFQKPSRTPLRSVAECRRNTAPTASAPASAIATAPMPVTTPAATASSAPIWV